MSVSYLYSSFIAKTFSTAVTLLAGIISLKLVSQYLSLTQFGLFMVAAQLLSYLPFIDGGLRTVINRELLAGSEEKKRNLLDFSQTFYTWFGALLLPLVSGVMVAYWATPNVAQSGEPLAFFVAIGVSIALLVFAFAQANLLIGLQAQGTLFWITGASNLIQLVLLYTGFRLGWQLWAYPFANGGAFLLTWPMIAFSIRRRVPGLALLRFKLSPDFWKELRSLREAAVNSFLSQIAILLLFTIDLVIVGLWVSLQEAALYALLLRVLSIVRSFIQSVGEVSWPVLAKNGEAGGMMTRLLLNLNAWIYGSVTGALAVFLLPFLAWYMEGNQWVAPEPLFLLLLARFLITGVQSPAGYFLISAGDFKSLARAMWRELIVAVGLSMALLSLEGTGVALGFLISTAFGTLFFNIAAYARHTEQSLGRVLIGIWTRTLAGGAVSLMVALTLLPLFPAFNGAIGGVLSAAIGLVVAAGVAAFRIFRTADAEFTWKQMVKFI